MADVEVSFRGLHCLVLDKGKQKGRIFLPCSHRALAADGNDRHLNQATYPYVAIPLADLAPNQPRPDMITGFKLSLNHQEPDGNVVLRTDLRLDVVLPEEKLALRNADGRVSYAIYFLRGRRLEIEPLIRKVTGLTWNDEPIDPKKRTPVTSVRWLPHLDEVGADSILPFNDLTQPAPYHDVGSFIDVNNGTLVPILETSVYPHRWRFLHSRGPFMREMADGSRITTPADSTFSVKLIVASTRRVERIDVTPKEAVSRIIIGNESLDDLLAVGRWGSCAEPAYHFESAYRLCDVLESPGFGRRLPVPLCVGAHDPDRDPPGAMCGPGLVLRRT
jgi:hypothetical protein